MSLQNSKIIKIREACLSDEKLLLTSMLFLTQQMEKFSLMTRRIFIRLHILKGRVMLGRIVSFCRMRKFVKTHLLAMTAKSEERYQEASFSRTQIKRIMDLWETLTSVRG